MKKIVKLFVFTLGAFLFINNINASLKCDVSIKETGINSARFNVNMDICKAKKWDGKTFREVKERKGSYESAYEYGEETLEVYFEKESADGKDIISGKTHVPVCSDGRRQVRALSECTAYKKANTVTHYCKNNFKDSVSCGNHSNCSWDNPNGICVGSWTTYDCDTGWTLDKKDGKYICKRSYDIDVVKGEAKKVSNQGANGYCKSATGADSCSCSTAQFALECPLYTCERTKVEVNACTPEFQDENGSYAYCINPGLKFSKDFQEDKDFDVRKCSSSYITPDCGFANILIEGAFHYQKGSSDSSTHNDAINLALRLWSYHTNQKGFDDIGKTGIANLTGSGCKTPISFMKAKGSNIRPNVYKETYDYIMKKNKTRYFDVAQDLMNKKGYIPDIRCNGKFDPENCRSAFTGSTFDKITCKNAPNGVVCGDDYIYRAAFELFFNTMLGNEYMITHLDNLSNVKGKWVTTTNVTLSEKEKDGKKKVWITTHYEKTEYEKVFGDVEEISCNEDDPIFKEHPEIAPYCKTEVIYKTPDGKTHTTYPEYCQKHDGCDSETNVTAICRTEKGGSSIYMVKTRDLSNPSATRIKKLIPCGDNDDNQIMFEYAKFNKKDSEKKEYTESEFYMNYNCGLTGGCSETQTRESKKCDKSGDVGKETVADPSLSCIVNMRNDSAKRLYDFSDRYGINTNFCRIYCSDKVDYYIAGDTYATDNTHFIYDVRSSATNSNLRNGKDLLSSVVKQKRTCVSEIFIDNLPTDVDWKGTYGLTDSENKDLMNNKTFSNLFNIMAKKAMNERNRTENLNQMIYDIYNCHLFNLEPKTIKDKYGIYKPGKYNTDYAWKTIQADYSKKKAYGIVDKSKNSDTVTYNGGAGVADSSIGPVKGYLGKEYPIKAGVINTGDVTTNSSLVRQNVKYCKGSSCLIYNGKDNYTYEEFGNINDSYYIKYYDKSHGFNFRYPTANYAMFQVSNEVGFYNDDLYQTYGGSGYISIVGDKGVNPDLLTLDKYTYQLDSNAATICGNCTVDSNGTKKCEGKCSVTQKINISPFFRATGTNNIDQFQKLISNRSLICSNIPTLSVGRVTCPPKNPNCVDWFTDLYRIADPANLFPYATDDESTENIPVNWKTPEGLAAIKQIEGNADKLTTTDELLEYRITLTPEQITNIQKYNNKSNGAGNYSRNKYYSQEEIKCNGKNISKDRERYEGCTSEFLDLLRNPEEGTKYGTLSPDYRGTSKYNSKN